MSKRPLEDADRDDASGPRRKQHRASSSSTPPPDVARQLKLMDVEAGLGRLAARSGMCNRCGGNVRGLYFDAPARDAGYRWLFPRVDPTNTRELPTEMGELFVFERQRRGLVPVRHRGEFFWSGPCVNGYRYPLDPNGRPTGPPTRPPGGVIRDERVDRHLRDVGYALLRLDMSARSQGFYMFSGWLTCVAQYL